MKRFLTTKSLVVFVVLSIIVFSILIFIGDYQKIAKELATVNLLIIPVVLFLAFIDDFIRFIKWDYYLKKLSIRIPSKMSFLIFFSGLSMSVTPSKVGEVLKSYLLKKAKGIKMRKTIMVVVSERLTDVLALGILSLIGFASFFSYTYFLLLIALMMVLLFSMFAVLTNKKLFFKFRGVLARIPVVKNYVKYIGHMHRTSKILLSYKSLGFATGISVVSWFFECLAFYILLIYLGAPIPLLSAVFIFSFSSIFGSALFFPGGLGAAESSFVLLLLIAGVPLATASLSTILIRLCTLFFGVFIGIISLFMVNRMIGKRRI
jgi:uncharacterized protein (TIRG00374 family)